MPDTFLADIHEAFQEIGGEIRSEGSEFDFRYSLVLRHAPSPSRLPL